MEVKRQEYRKGFVVPDMDEVKLALARALVFRSDWGNVHLHGGKVVFGELSPRSEKREVLQAHIDEVTTAMELALNTGNYWFQSYHTPHYWMPVVRRIGNLYHVENMERVSGMDHFARLYEQQQSLTMLWLEAQFPVSESAKPGEMVELDLRPVADALAGSSFSQYTAAQIAAAICRGYLYPSESKPHIGGNILLFTDSRVSILLDVAEGTVGSFGTGWHQKKDEPWIIQVPTAPDTSTDEQEDAGAVYAPALRFTFTGSIDPEILGPSAMHGIGGNSGLPIVTSKHESYVQALAGDLESRLRSIKLS